MPSGACGPVKGLAKSRSAISLNITTSGYCSYQTRPGLGQAFGHITTKSHIFRIYFSKLLNLFADCRCQRLAMVSPDPKRFLTPYAEVLQRIRHFLSPPLALLYGISVHLVSHKYWAGGHAAVTDSDLETLLQ